MEHIYVLKNLTCANCAAKIEDRIRALPDVEAADFAIGTQQLRVRGRQVDTPVFKDTVQAICDATEDGVVVEPFVRTSKGSEEEEHHHDSSLTAIIIGAIVMAVTGFTDWIPETAERIVLVLTYLLLGWRVLWGAIKNIVGGQIFDENFLMAIATIGAMSIGEYPEAAGVMLFFQIGSYFEEHATKRSRSAIMEAVDMRPEEVRLVNADGSVTVTAPDAVRIGDLVEVRAGDRIPLDGTVVEGETRIDTAPVTGEPVPISAGPGTAILSGCVNESGRIVVRVDKELSESMVTRILDAVEHAAASKPRIDRFITRFARIYTPIVVALAVLTAVIPSLITGQWEYWIYTALTFLVISCPCALVLSVPLAFFAGIGRASKEGILFKGGASIEAMRAITAVALDKTGTVTTGRFAVQSVEGTKAWDELTVLGYAASLEASSTHPIALSISEEAKARHIQAQPVENLQELSGRGMVGTVEGKRILLGNRRLLDEEGITGYPQAPSAYGSEVLMAVDGSYAGRISIADSLKEDTVEAVAGLRRRGLETVMLTGDNWESANYIANEAGIQTVRAELLPEDKLQEMAQLRREFGPVMFVGDGINDAPVLAGADVGGAMGTGADAAIEAADVVYMRPGIGSVLKSFSIASSTLSIAWQNVVIALGIKIAIMILGLVGYANMWLAVFADTGVSMICILNSIRILYKKA